MAKRFSIGLAAAGIIGLLMSAAVWHSASAMIQNFISSARPFQDQAVITAIVEDSIHNPDIQQILRTQFMLYLRSAESKAKMLELMKSPEVIQAMAENLKSPELRPEVIKLLHDPAFRETLIEIMRETPEMRLLQALESAVEWNTPAVTK